MNEIQQLLIDYLVGQKTFYETSRKLFMAPAERARMVTFYTNSIDEVKRLIAAEEAALQDRGIYE